MTKYSLSIEARLIEVRELKKWLTKIERSCSMTPKGVDKIELALAEVCNNIIKHGYGEVGETKSSFGIRLEAVVEQSTLKVSITDEAPEFNYEEDREIHIDEPKIHGYGLMIVQKLTEKLTVRRINGQNVWNLVFPLEVFAS